jgi:hypothetical protein
MWRLLSLARQPKARTETPLANMRFSVEVTIPFDENSNGRSSRRLTMRS